MLKKFVKDLATYAPSQFLPAITAFITTPILTRLFLPVEYGYWALAASISSFLVALAVSGFGSAVLRYHPTYKSKETLNIFFVTLGVSIVIAVIVVTGISYIVFLLFGKFLSASLIRFLPLIILIFVAQSIFTVFITVIRAQRRSSLYTSFQLFMSYGSLGIGLLLVVFFDFQVDGLLWGTLIALILTVPLLIIFATRGVDFHLRDFHVSEARQLWNYAWPLTIGNVAMWGLRVSDLFIINLFRPDQDVGLYSVSYNISSKSIELLVTLFMLSISPLIYSTWESEGRVATEKTLTMVTRVYLVLCLPAAVGMSVLAFPFVMLLTAPAYYEGFRIVGFVVFSSFAWGLSQIAMTGMTIQKQAGRLGTNQVVAALIHIGLQLLLVPRFGYVAAAISTLIGYAVLLILNTLASRPYLAWRFPLSTLRNVLVASGVMGIVAGGVYRVFGDMGRDLLVNLFLSIALAVFTYIICLWGLGEIKEEEKNTIWQLFLRLRTKDV